MREYSAYLVRVKKTDVGICHQTENQKEDVGIRSRCCTYVSSKSQKNHTSEIKMKFWYLVPSCGLPADPAIGKEVLAGTRYIRMPVRTPH